MAFSIRNIFQKGAQPEGEPGGSTGEFPMFGTGGATTAVSPNPFGMPVDPAGNIGFGGSIFKARDQGEDMQGQPVNARPGGSPFSPFGAQEGVSLTVGDLLPQLPPELVRGGGASPDQPVTISPQALEAALADGSLSVPVFEVYRVCPVLFQVPVSPQDPRVVPLPHHKLVALMSGRGASGTSQPPMFQQSAPPSGAASGGSPFAFSPAPPEMSMQTPTGGMRPAGALPPRRPAGVPPAIPSQTDFAPMPALQLPGQAIPPSPPSVASPFGFQQPASPFAAQEPTSAPPHGQSPFGTSPAGPFGASPPPLPSQQGLNSFTSLLSSASSPVTDPELAGGPFAPQSASPFAMQAQVPVENISPFTAPSASSPFAPQPQSSSPFGASPQGGGSTFAPQPQGGGSPFAAQPQGGSPFVPQTQENGLPFPPQPMSGGSPFAPQPQGGSPFAAQPQSGSPFAEQPHAGGASPFGSGSGNTSPFTVPSMGAEPPFSPPHASGSPFAMPTGGSPFPAPAAASSFGMPAAPKQPEPGASPFAGGGASFEPTPRPTTPEPPKLGAVPFSSPPIQPSAGSSSFTLPAMPTAPSRPMAGAAAKPADDTVDISLAAVLKGQTPQDLGFDPNFIPAWINTKLSSSLVRQQLPSGQVVIDLGTIIDGTENTFRTVIAHGKRDFNVRVPANEIFHLLPPVSGGSGPLAAEPAQAPAGPAPSAAPVATFLPVMPEAPASAAAPSAPSGIIQPLGFQLPFSPTPAPRSPEPPAPAQEPEAFVPPAQPKVQPLTSFDPFAANAGDWTGKSQTAYFEPPRPNEAEGGLGSEQLFAPAAPQLPPQAEVLPFGAVAASVSAPSLFPVARPEPEMARPQPPAESDPFAGMGDNPFLPQPHAVSQPTPEPVAPAPEPATPDFPPTFPPPAAASLPPSPAPVFPSAPEAPRA
ncbi:MAG: hypothetical protein JWO89_1978, partial [Verrucomicrobiaceae bacterium]|nr:hypothetical protein [Verrucomicrobiaceae bacterium]